MGIWYNHMMSEVPPKPSATDELVEALEHLKTAATTLLKRANEEGAVKTAAQEAERAVHHVSVAAEPVLKKLTHEVKRITQEIKEELKDKFEGRRKTEAPPPEISDT